MRALFWIVVLPVSLIVLVFAAINTATVEVDLFVGTVPLPLFAIALVGVFIGFVWGGLISWLHAGKSRARAREYVRQVETDRREIALLQEKLRKLERAERQATIPLPPANAA
ncbi:MAG: lipopolysaccharide assembly LapA domain-containing protein [Rhodospirillales bacterium]